ncbi:MAG: hypothetical protein E7262_08805 [Lachnospiraceae bacterium]|nr:hypothetical protein [Lachnospiraceae bacterium]
MRKSIKRGIAIVAASAMALSIVSVGNVMKSDAASVSRDIKNMARRTNISLDYNDKLSITRDELADTSMGKEDSSTMFIYMCGSDLESYYGLANMDINEMIAAQESDNVNIVIQTGGARTWRGNGISNSQIGRYVVKNNKLQLVESLPQANMGEAQTLESFLTWGVENYAAEHMSVVFWNHGGGSIDGVCFDERNSYDSLSLSEVEIALANATENMTDKFDYIGFDACLMGTIEVANMLKPYAEYMIGSEEVEPGYGWEYTSIVDRMVANPDVDPEELGKLIVDTYYTSTAAIGQGASATLSLVDLDKLDEVMIEFNEVAKEMNELADVKANITKLTSLANSSDNYGGNNAYEGYTNMVDLGDFMQNIAPYVEGTEDVLEAIEEAVVYQRIGNSHADATGIAFFYPLQTPSLAELNYMRNLGVSPYFAEYMDKVLFTAKYGSIDGFVSNDWANNGYFYDLDFEYIDNEFTSITGYEKLKTKSYFKAASFDDNWYKWFYKKSLVDMEVSDELADDVIVSDDNVVLDLDNETAEDASDAKVAVVVENGDDVSILGAIAQDDEQVKFDGKWFTLADGQVLAAEVVSENDKVVLYTAPAVVNGKTTNVRFTVENNDITVLGTWDGINEFGMAAKGIKEIKKGSTITPLYMTVDTQTNDVDMVKGDSVVVANEIITVDDIQEDYSFAAQVEDAFGNVTISTPVK